MLNLDTTIGLTADDILLIPKKGVVPSRSDVKKESFLINAPMGAVFSGDLLESLYKVEEYACWPRTKEARESYKILGCYRKEWIEEKVFFCCPLDIQETDKIIKEIRKYYKGPINLALDIAHGHCNLALEWGKYFSRRENINHLMTGSIATAEAYHELYGAGFDFFRIGIGNGAACTTRLATGVGIPQLTAIMQIAYAKHLHIFRKRPYLIADGGIEKSADIVKYLAAGADLVMLGKMLAKTTESGGWREDETKIYYGHASKIYKEMEGLNQTFIEGQYFPLTEQYSFEDFYRSLKENVQSACSYIGMDEMSDLQEEWHDAIQVSSNTLNESAVRR